MRNPFIAVALAAAFMARQVQTSALASFKSGVFADPPAPSAKARETGHTVAADKRAAVKAKNKSRHRRACRGN